MWSLFWENQGLVKTLYSRCVEPVCHRHELARIELDVLLFLANNPQFDTASDIVEHRMLTKSHVSMAVSSLVKKGLLDRSKADSRKRVHLSVTAEASNIVADGQEAQRAFLSVLFQEFSDGDRKQLTEYWERSSASIRAYLREP